MIGSVAFHRERHFPVFAVDDTEDLFGGQGIDVRGSRIGLFGE